MKIVMLAAVVVIQMLIAIGNAHAGSTNNVHVPEPTSLALLTIGAAAVAAGAWWRNRK